MKTTQQKLSQKLLKELKELEKEKRMELFTARMKHYSGQLMDVSQLKKLKKEVAAILTVIHQKENEEQSSAHNS
ncbi:50S ribosomal protein L29 [bacterium]|nr:50S ribosomal protein L29 [bacterium]